MGLACEWAELRLFPYKADFVQMAYNTTATLCKMCADDQHGTPTLVRVLPCDSVNAGVGSLELYDNKLFVGREGGAQVEVYDARTWSLIRRLSIAGLGNSVYGLAACDYNKCLYVSDRYKSCVHKVDLSTYDVMLKWSVADCPWGLSVNGAHNVLVACYKADRIQEYSSVGSLVRNICIAGNSPFHGIQISYDRIVVSHSGTSHTVCMVGVDGQVIKRYGQQQGSAVRQLNYPECIAVDKQGCILVADYCNSRIMVLNQLLTDTRQLSLTADGGLRRPVSIHFDESRDRLYVGEGGGLCRVLVFDDVCHMSALFNN